MLTGRGLTARAARAIGLVDAAEPQRQMERAVRKIAQTQPQRQQMPLLGKLLSLPGVRHSLAGYMKKQVAKKSTAPALPCPLRHPRRLGWLLRQPQTHDGRGGQLGGTPDPG